MSQLFLGLDSSTQSLSAVVIDYETKQIVYEGTVQFDQELPHYRTIYGSLLNADLHIKHSPPLMWVEALDLLLSRMKRDGVPLHAVLASSGSAQQHGSVYLNQAGVQALHHLDSSISLKENLKNAFSRESAPIWMDTSTSLECQEIQNALGSAQNLIQATGSKAFERFTGPQVRKFFKNDPDNYANTDKICLISSFMASLFAGKLAPIDHADGSGMNLMDIRNKAWHPEMLQATAPSLMSRLPRLASSSTVLGPVSPYLQKKYGFDPHSLAVAWSGDNPNSLIGLGIIDEGTAAISLGTSFTYFGYMKELHLDTEGKGHVFVAPTDEYMSLICFKNGALAIEKIRSLYSLDWEGFNQALIKTRPGNQGSILLPYFEPEIVPSIAKPGLYRFNLQPQDVLGNCRALIEAQMMSMKLHSGWMKNRPTRISVTGGASINPHILQVLADVFDCEVHQISFSKSAALGAAMRAAHSYFKHQGPARTWREIVSDFMSRQASHSIKPSVSHAQVYAQLTERYADCERRVLNPA